jgi:hypothetical protein
MSWRNIIICTLNCHGSCGKLNYTPDFLIPRRFSDEYDPVSGRWRHMEVGCVATVITILRVNE